MGSESHADVRPTGLPAVSLPQTQVTLVEGSTFCVSGVHGDVQPGRAEGLFVRDTRVISHWELRIDGEPLEALTVIPGEPFEQRFISRAPARAGLVEPTLIVERRRLVGQGMREDITVRNYGAEAAGIHLTLTADADFADLFQVKERGTGAVGSVTHTQAGNDLLFRAERGGEHRGVRVTAAGAIASPHTLTYRAVVPPHGEWSTTVNVHPSASGRELDIAFPAGQAVEAAQPARRMHSWRERTPRIEVANTVLASALRTSEQDLGALRITDPDHPEDDVVAAGAPWFMALFGRDSLLTSWMVLPFAPSLVLGTLTTLARLQGGRGNPMTEEEPGKILHEVRHGADLSLALGGDSVYYGSIDSTPLFLMLTGRALRWGTPPEELLPLQQAVRAAAQWLVRSGDRDGDGFLEYQRSSDRGLANQGWKDSHDSIATSAGRQAVTPIALAEVQGYAYAAYLAVAELEEAWGHPEQGQGWRRRAAELKERFHTAFWMPQHSFYALALDGHKNQVDALSSNIGHCLWTGIVDEDHAGKVVDRLISADLFSGFGIRTRSASSAIFNPASYHNGSVWPHDTVLGAAGMARYGFREAALTVLTALTDALEAFGGRLPELFCGFSRADMPIPVPYPTSCSPQAWAAAVPYEMLRIALDLEVDVLAGRVDAAPAPALFGTLSVHGISLGAHGWLDVVADQQNIRLEGLPERFRGPLPATL
ncbi:amylo-alpha-1,6-glucosidase [Nesterenkonia alkaliphila]|uniref:Amylo-alpha-1,6-glucosidase n=1 Tax=Nesterenkonia alkaliphila TaxID=1463631 RepID=A0A7K1ULN9_9MICC|nr:glycogen debranching N-terminal domain-containing protein [Nesterenkonia alkaliphila]MVT27346.1 amylo-alpha-1,6-glucosidase [Nesterenkonia alkaliphila]GFZ80685.1 amylo-alpha-1,6-glucosidase [Nesterenkonia alkaliphila]